VKSVSTSQSSARQHPDQGISVGVHDEVLAPYGYDKNVLRFPKSPRRNNTLERNPHRVDKVWPNVTDYFSHLPAGPHSAESGNPDLHACGTGAESLQRLL
jgi:hypothetical protein